MLMTQLVPHRSSSLMFSVYSFLIFQKLFAALPFQSPFLYVGYRVAFDYSRNGTKVIHIAVIQTWHQTCRN